MFPLPPMISGYPPRPWSSRYRLLEPGKRPCTGVRFNDGKNAGHAVVQQRSRTRFPVLVPPTTMVWAAVEPAFWMLATVTFAVVGLIVAVPAPPPEPAVRAARADRTPFAPVTFMVPLLAIVVPPVTPRFFPVPPVALSRSTFTVKDPAAASCRILRNNIVCALASSVPLARSWRVVPLPNPIVLFPHKHRGGRCSRRLHRAVAAAQCASRQSGDTGVAVGRIVEGQCSASGLIEPPAPR